MFRSGLCVATVLLTTVPVVPQVISYEATSFPEEAGWTRRNVLYLADRWLDNEWFVQFTEMVQPTPEGPLESEQDWYEYSLASFAGSGTWYCQWLMITDGPSSAIPAAAPAVVSVSGYSGILYHFTIAEDKVRLIRDAGLPMVWADIAPGVPHTYRLELYGAETYIFFIDGEVIDTGVPEGPYPTTDSKLVFGARAPGEPATTQWDYLRFGVIPQPNSGDYDSDNDLDLADLYFFLDCLLGPEYDAGGPGCTWADMNNDGVTNGADITQFIEAMLL